MSKFYFGVFLPSIGRKVYFSELTIAQQKNIIKTIMNNDEYALYSCFNAIIKENCKEDIDALRITIFDRFIILLTMRVVSTGTTQKIQLTSGDDSKNTYTTTVDYNAFVELLERTKFDESQTIKYNSLVVEYGLPLASRVVEFGSDEYSSFTYILTSIKSIKIGEADLFLDNISIPDLINIVENLPNKVTQEIQSYLHTQEEKINRIKFLSVEDPYTQKSVEIALSLNHAVLDKILKLAFKSDLHDIYKAIYYMVNVLGFTPEYAESITYNERQLFWSYHQADEREKERARSQDQTPSTKGLPPLRDATADFIREIHG